MSENASENMILSDDVSGSEPAPWGSPVERMLRAARGSTVVVITDIAFWWPVYGSHSRIVGMLMALARYFDVRVFCHYNLSDMDRQSIADKGWPFEIVSYKAYENHENVRKYAMGAMARMSELEPFARHELYAAVAAYMRKVDAQAGIIEYVKLAYLVEAFPPGCARLLDTHDAQSQRARTFAAYQKAPTLQVSMTSERRILAHFDAVIGISRTDCEFFRNHLKLNNVLYVPHAVQASCRAATADPRRIVFLGAASEPNMDGLKWFIQQVWPVVRDRSRLDIIGSAGLELPASLKKDPNIVIHGLVQSLHGIYENAIAINPVFYGGGMKIKSLDALAAGCALVTTSEGARGLEPWQDEAYLVANSRSEFVGYLTALQADPMRAARLGQAGLDVTRQFFSEEVVYRDIVGFLAAC